jgi:hypothetical protein
MRLVREAPGVGGDGHVERREHFDGQPPVGGGFAGTFGRGRIDVAADDGRALLGEEQRTALADPGARAGDEGDFPGEPAGHLDPLREAVVRDRGAARSLLSVDTMGKSRG